MFELLQEQRSAKRRKKEPRKRLPPINQGMGSKKPKKKSISFMNMFQKKTKSQIRVF